MTDWYLEEGETWDALKAGLKQGVKAYRQIDGLLNARTEAEVKAAAEKIVEKGYRIEEKPKSWLLEAQDGWKSVLLLQPEAWRR